MLLLPKPLLVTRAYCSEVTIRVPSWTVADKYVQEPLSIRVVDLFIDVKNAGDCDDANCRAQAATMEPDPLGSIASWYAFSTILNERVEFVVENVYLKLFTSGIARVRIELTNFHARTTNSLWQDMRDLTACVDRSPDGLLKTRFRFVSFGCSILLTQPERGTAGLDAPPNKTSGKGTAPASSHPPVKLLHDHTVSLRMTLFGHRASKHDVWETLSQVIDVNLHTLLFDYDVVQLVQIFDVYSTINGWLQSAAEHERVAKASGAGLDTSELLLHHHQVQRGAVMTPKRGTHNVGADDSSDEGNEASFALQLTFRFSADATFRFVSERLGEQHVTLSVQHAAINVIVHHDNVCELQVTVHEVTGRFQDRLVLLIKPDRDVLQFKRLRERSVVVKWRLEKVACTIEGDLALVLNEAYHAYNEKTQSSFIKCGACAQQIRLESIETHVCSPPPVRSPASSTASGSGVRNRSQESRHSSSPSDASVAEGESGNASRLLSDVAIAAPPRLRLVFALNDLELNCDSHLFHNVQQLISTPTRVGGAERPSNSSSHLADRKLVLCASDLQITTEAREFVGDAIFVPVLPLAFQMLECALQGCDCIRLKKERASGTKTESRTRSPRASTSSVSDEVQARTHSMKLLRWPERVFIELGRVRCSARHTASPSVESFVVVEQLALRASFSEGERVCTNCQPQLSAHVAVTRVRCQLDSSAFRFIKYTLGTTEATYDGNFDVVALLFFAVLEIRTVEFTLLQNDGASRLAKLKNLLKNVSVVGDNQLGHNTLQSSLDFRSLFHAHMLRVFHRDARQADATVATSENEGSPLRAPSRHQSRRQRLQREQERAARSIQRLVRRVRTNHNALHPSQRPADTEAGDPTSSTTSSNSIASVSDHHATQRVSRDDNNAREVTPPPPPSPSRKNSKSAASLFGVADDLVSANRKVVAAASVISNFVKTKQQQLESEVVGLAVHSKESAARLVLPPFAAYKKMFGRDATTPTGATPTRTNDAAERSQLGPRRTTESGSNSTSRASSASRSVELSAGDFRRSADGRSSGDGDGADGDELPPATASTTCEDTSKRLRLRDDRASRSSSRSSRCEDREGSNTAQSEDNCGHEALGPSDKHTDLDVKEQDKRKDGDDEGDALENETTPAREEVDESRHLEAEFPLSDAADVLARLPELVRVLVQVNAHRLRVPISPREKVGFLCREVVRRFNELFGAQRGFVSHVVLQDARGGAFLPTDIVGFVYASEAEVVYAVPVQADEKVRCVAHVEPYKSSCSVPATRHDTKTGLKATVGHSFIRCSKLPLPLATALLANENERDLVRCVMRDGGNAGKDANEWPELALDVSFLDPAHILSVEVRWVGECVEVTNADAFVLCLQQLGLCTSRASSKYIGKILRDRLKMDALNPLVRSACVRSGDFAVSTGAEVEEAEETESSSEAGVSNASLAAISYESLKQIVQDAYGVYTTR